MKNVMAEVAEERQWQDTKWGIQDHHPYQWLVILMEEVGEASQAALNGSLIRYRDELIHVAAVSVAAIEALDRGKWEKK